jgi:transposase
VLVLERMSTDVFASTASVAAATAGDAPAEAPVVVIPVNQGPINTGIRVPVAQIALDELLRRERAEREGGNAASAHRGGAANLDPPLPTDVIALRRLQAELQQSLARIEELLRCQRAEHDAHRANGAGSTDGAEGVATSDRTRWLPSSVPVLQNMVVESQDAVAVLRKRVAELECTIDQLLRRLLRPSRDVWSADQPALFPEMHPHAADTTAAETATSATPEPNAAEPAANTPAPEPKPAKKNPKKKHGRRSLKELIQKLDHERREHTLTEAERLCPCCGRLRVKIGEQTTRQLEYIPAKLICVNHAQLTYSCPACPEHIVTAPKPPQPIDRGMPGPALCALVAASKFDDYLPLYRQELILSRCGLFLARSTLCDWLMALGTLVKPLVERMKADVFQSRVVQTDGTSIDVLLDGQRTARTGYFWPYLGDDAHPSVVVDFSLDKCKEHPQTFLADYTGYVQVDAYSAYDGCFVCDANHPKIEVGCWSHTERYFEDALQTNPAQAAEGLAFISALFALEARAKRDHLSEAEVLALRQREAVPMLDEFATWLERTEGQALPKSPLGAAIRYTRNQWQALRRYTEAGFLTMDNNATERINKLMARGRVNWLFVGSPRGGVTASRLLSLVATCRRLHMDSFAYLRDVFTRLPGMAEEQLDELLPHRWLASHPEARHPPERSGRGHGDSSPRRKRRRRPN